jgi:MFS family permease
MRQVPVSSWRSAIFASVGSGLEYYAFICFALQAGVLSQLFFNNHRWAVLETFATFAIGTVIMPLAGFFWGRVADQYGRKEVFLMAILLMVFATVGIGLLPSTWDGYGVGLLLVLRLFQGVAQGAELPGAITFICEHAQATRRGFSIGLLFFGVALGAGLATLVNFLVSYFFTTAQILAYAWRLPFLLALVLGIVGYLLRRRVVETPLFLRYSTQVQVRQLDMRKVLQGAGLVWFAAVMVSLGLFWPTFLTYYLHFSAHIVFLAMTLAFVGTAFLLPVFGYWSDRLGRKKIYGLGLFLALVSLYPMIRLLAQASVAYLFVFTFWYYLLIVILAANYPVMLAELFVTRVRYQAVALSYAGCYAVAGLVPVLVSALILKFAILSVLLVVLYGSAFISLLSWCYYQEHVGELH